MTCDATTAPCCNVMAPMMAMMAPLSTTSAPEARSFCTYCTLVEFLRTGDVCTCLGFHRTTSINPTSAAKPDSLSLPTTSLGPLIERLSTDCKFGCTNGWRSNPSSKFGVPIGPWATIVFVVSMTRVIRPGRVSIDQHSSLVPPT